jgi:molecular chaperone GrpE (heat shock protein)
MKGIKMEKNTIENQQLNDSEKPESKIDANQRENSEKVNSQNDKRRLTAMERQAERLKLAQKKLDDFTKKNQKAKSDLSQLKAELKRSKNEEAKKAKNTLIYKLGEIALYLMNSDEPITAEILSDRVDPKVLERYRATQKDLQTENPA